MYLSGYISSISCSEEDDHLDWVWKLVFCYIHCVKTADPTHNVSTCSLLLTVLWEFPIFIQMALMRCGKYLRKYLQKIELKQPGRTFHRNFYNRPIYTNVPYAETCRTEEHFIQKTSFVLDCSGWDTKVCKCSGWVGEWVSVRVGEWVSGWVCGWVCGWVGGCVGGLAAGR